MWCCSHTVQIGSSRSRSLAAHVIRNTRLLSRNRKFNSDPPRNSGSDRRTWTPIPKFFSPRRFNTFRTRDALSSATAYPLNEASLHQKPASPHNECSRTHPSVSQRCHQHKQTRERVGECRSSLLSTQGASRTREHLFLHPSCHNAQ